MFKIVKSLKMFTGFTAFNALTALNIFQEVTNGFPNELLAKEITDRVTNACPLS